MGVASSVMLSRVLSAGLHGIEGFLVDVEVDIALGLANWNTVGLPESCVRESRDRVIAAIKNSGYTFERRRITINLAPADVKKEGTGFDLPIAVGLLASSELVTTDALQGQVLLGELSLHGEIKPVRGALPIALLCRKKGLRRLLLPAANAAEVSVVSGLEICAVGHLSDVVGHLTGERPLTPLPARDFADFRASRSPAETEGVDLSDIKGQIQAKRALEVAAAGQHHLLLIGPPGSGKTMLAQRLPTILPDMSFEESLETSKIYSVVGLLGGNGGEPLVTRRPFRSPHHTISTAGLAGGGSHPRPGEISLAHNGVLFLDEFPEFPRNVLEVLRQPLESGHVTIARALSTITVPSRVQLVASMNPCKCGFRGSLLKDCVCSEKSLLLYRSKLSGPLLDRIDIQIEVPPVPYGDLASQREGESSASIRERVVRARGIQKDRFRGLKIHANGQMSGRILRKVCALDAAGASLLEKAVAKLALSARAYDRILKVARTVADLGGSDAVEARHLAEAIQYRSLDRGLL